MTPETSSENSDVSELTDQEAAERRFSEIGRRLREGRQKRAMSLAEVATQLHLPSIVIDDIEQGRLTRLAPLYRRGYVANYARLLGLDEQDLLARLGSDSPPQLTRVLPVKSPRFKFDRYMKLASYLIVTIVIVPPLIMIYLNTGSRLFHDGRESVVEQLERAPLDLDRPAVDNAEEASTVERPTQSGGLSNRPSINQPVAASTLPLSGIRPLRDSATEPERSISLTPPSEPESSDPVVFELLVRLKEDSWVEITDADEQRLEYDLLRAGQSRSYLGQAPFRILLGRSNAVELSMDGQALRYEGDERADVVTLVVQQDGQVLR